MLLAAMDNEMRQTRALEMLEQSLPFFVGAAGAAYILWHQAPPFDTLQVPDRQIEQQINSNFFFGDFGPSFCLCLLVAY